MTIELRDLQDDDVERLFRWRREPEVDRWMYELPPEEFSAHQRWFDHFRGDPDQAAWIITSKGQGCGLIYLKGLTGSQHRAEYRWYIGEAEARGRGAGRAAQALGLDRAVFDLGLQKVWSEVLADNETALKAQAAAGFRREGYLRRHAFKHDRYRDVVLLAVLAEEWAQRRDGVRRNLVQSGLIAA